MKYQMVKKMLVLIVCSGIIVSCGDDAVTAPVDTSFDFSGILTDFADFTVIPTYGDMDAKSGELLTAVRNLRTSPSAASLATARAAWQATRVPWEASEGFLFGPVDFDGFDPALDTWPVNRTDLESVLSSDTALSTTSVNALDNTLKGFHTIEFLLYDEGGAKTAADFTDRQFDYLIASAELLRIAAEDLHLSWTTGGGNFRSKVVTAGSGSTVYPSQKAAIQEIVNAMIGICDEVANGKIADPFTEQDTRLVESQFSFNSLLDFQNNVRSVQNVYEGGYIVEARGLDVFVANRNATLDTRLKTEIQTAITEIGRISFPFRDAIFSDAAQIQTAQAAVATIQATLEGDVLSLVLSE